jgi:hypothetical protein
MPFMVLMVAPRSAMLSVTGDDGSLGYLSHASPPTVHYADDPGMGRHTLTIGRQDRDGQGGEWVEYVEASHRAEQLPDRKQDGRSSERRHCAGEIGAT